MGDLRATAGPLPAGPVKLSRLLARPPVLTGAGGDVWHFLCLRSEELNPDHPLARSVARLLREGGRPRRMSLAPRVRLFDLGGDGPDPGLVLCLPGRGGGGHAARATWVAWGLPRPSVNLSLGPILARLSPRILEAGSDTEREDEILKAFSGMEINTDVRVEQVLTPLSYRIYPETPIGEIQNLMLRREVSAVPVVGASHELLGVVTIGDVLPHILPGREPGSSDADPPLARHIMTRSVLCVSEDESLLVASRSMIARGVSRLPVVRDGELIGFLDRGTVMRAFAEAIATSPV